jgi:hypothetical protein
MFKLNFVVTFPFIRFPQLDDQAIFWRIIRTTSSPHIVPLSTCHDVNTTAQGGASGSSSLGDLITCPLDTCEFSSGMLSRLWVPEYTYGKNSSFVSK